MAVGTSLNVGGLPPETVYQTLVSKGISQSEATSFVGSWLLQVLGQTARTFDYKQAFPAVDPNCASQFARTFAHADWVDGESVVQAQQTTGEMGFNARFHRVESDIDGLGAEVARAFACVAEMRKEMRALLDEIKTELNRIDADIYPGGFRQGPLATFDAGAIKTGTFLGTAKLGAQDMTMWQTTQGMMMLPSVSAVHPDPSQDPRVLRVAKIARFVEETPNVKTAFNNQPFTTKDFITKFGNTALPDSGTVADQLAILPPTATYATADAFVADLSDREAAALRSTAGAEGVVSSALGLDSPSQAVGTASVQKLGDLPQDARDALAKNGIDTIGKLSDAGQQKIAEVLRKENVTSMTTGDIAAVGTKARTLTRIR